MPSTFTSRHYHLVFSTHQRIPFIRDSWITRLHEYLGGTVTGLGATSQGVGGIADHVHLLVALKPTHCLSDFMRELKKSSSQWVHSEIRDRAFAWQEGYSAFTVSATARHSVKAYIANQADHHRVKPFRAELIEMLMRAGIEFEERFLDGHFTPRGGLRPGSGIHRELCGSANRGRTVLSPLRGEKTF